MSRNFNEEFQVKLEIAKFFKDGNKYDVDFEGLVEYIANIKEFITQPKTELVDKEYIIQGLKEIAEDCNIYGKDGKVIGTLKLISENKFELVASKFATKPGFSVELAIASLNAARSNVYFNHSLADECIKDAIKELTKEQR